MKPNKTSISGLIITFNEEKHIAKVIDSLSFVDELIVVDSFSTDRTLKILQAYPDVNVIQREFKNFSDQRNFAIEQASQDWILFIDADERLSSELIEEIKRVVKNQDNIVAYKVHRKFMFRDKVLHYSGLQTDYIFRLFKKGKAKYNANQKVHEILKPNGLTATLKHSMLHYSFDNYENYKTKIEHYAELNAQELYENGKRPNWFVKTFKPAYKFWYNYVFRLGFLDGKEGYTICKLHAYGVTHRYRVLEALLVGSPEQ